MKFRLEIYYYSKLIFWQINKFKLVPHFIFIENYNYSDIEFQIILTS